MRFPLSLLFALAGSAILNVTAIPVARQQAIQEIQTGETDITQLLAYIVQSNSAAAQSQYRSVQKQLDNLGMYLGQKPGSSCSGPSTGSSSSSSSSVTAATDETAVLQTLQIMQNDLLQLEQDIINGGTTAGVTAWVAAQQGLDSTYDYVFGSS